MNSFLCTHELTFSSPYLNSPHNPYQPDLAGSASSRPFPAATVTGLLDACVPAVAAVRDRLEHALLLRLQLQLHNHPCDADHHASHQGADYEARHDVDVVVVAGAGAIDLEHARVDPGHEALVNVDEDQVHDTDGEHESANNRGGDGQDLLLDLDRDQPADDGGQNYAPVLGQIVVQLCLLLKVDHQKDVQVVADARADGRAKREERQLFDLIQDGRPDRAADQRGNPERPATEEGRGHIHQAARGPESQNQTGAKACHQENNLDKLVADEAQGHADDYQCDVEGGAAPSHFLNHVLPVRDALVLGLGGGE